MAASEIVEIYIQGNQQQQNLHLEAALQSGSGKQILSKPGQNPWETPAKEPTLQQSCRVEACICTKNEPSHSHLPRILPRSWVIIYDYFKNLRTNFIPEYFSMVASIHYAFSYCNVMTANFTKYNLNNCLLWFKICN